MTIHDEIHKKIYDFRNNPTLREPNLMIIPINKFHELRRELNSVQRSRRGAGYLYEYRGMKIIVTDAVNEITLTFEDWIETHCTKYNGEK